jgi:hypothetical protein
MSKFKVGDRVRGGESDATVIETRHDGNFRVRWDHNNDEGGFDGTVFWPGDGFSLVTPSPVRTVTRREIMPGAYGPVAIYKDYSATVGALNAAVAREAARIFNEIADALDEGATQ